VKQQTTTSALLIVVAVIVYFGLYIGAGALVDFATNPLATFSDASNSVRERLYGFFQPSRLAPTQQNLNERIVVLEGKLAALGAVDAENERLRALLDLPQRTSYSLIETSAVTYDPISQQTVITIVGGENESIQKGMAVIDPFGVFIGKVSDVFEQRSFVRLTTDIQSSITAQVQHSSTFGLVSGRHGVGLLFRQIPVEATIEPGDIIVTNNQDPMIPAGLLIGRVLAVETPQGQTFKEARITPAFQATAFDQLFLLHKNSEQ